MRLYDATDGQIDFDGQDITHLKGKELRTLRRDMQMIFQDPFASLNPRKTVGAIIGEPFRLHQTVPKDKVKGEVQDLMKLVGLNPEHYNRYPHEFSGGQRQRIGVARSLALRPKLIVCDEPVSALDVSIQAQIINLLEDLQEEFKLTYLFIAHDLSVVKHISDRVAVMYLGKIVEIGPPDIMYANPGHPYTRALLSAVPVPDPVLERKRKRVILKGDVPSPVNPPEGCRFHTRCWLYERLGQPEECRTIDPPVRILQGDHGAACHFAEQALASDVGVSHIEMSPVRRGTPEAALNAIRPELAGAMSESRTVDVAETVIGGPPTIGEGDGDGTDGVPAAGDDTTDAASPDDSKPSS
jgi:peptide/nickel transport system ATP-binding protein/oligopeptide transport system ATP-binding protein